ncbi:hypothetical protein JNB_18568 [Janibacter sp. HTCC2649]|uniref:hypothetical protein n=1 Tax=Janibacter sp. HTCC2649 TaxID=313589 RepID=UPI0000670ED5|nr:hypothetical protein [Janibacter sp. HTCC2649]EAP97502.1 hypothetical protein JNB_18568 [Janibacter sp. HTCC2649]
MSLSDYVSSTSAAVGADAVVTLLAGSETLNGVVPTNLARTDAGESEGGRAVVVAHAPQGEEVTALETLAEAIGDRGVGILALVVAPDALPVGPLVAAATETGLRVVRAQGVQHRRARSVLTVTRDSEVPVTAYLAATPVATDERATLRLANEWLVEGLALRAGLERLAARQRGAEYEAAQLRLRLDEFQTRARDERADLQSEIAVAQKAARDARARAAQGPAVRAKRAVAILREDPVGGSRRIARSAAKRLGR